MNKIQKTIAIIAAAVIITSAAHIAQAQGGGGMMGRGMMGRCPMCGGPMMGGFTSSIPDKLPTPKNKQWISRLRTILSMERLSKAQYSADEEKYNAMMPYRMIIPQENSHIDLISKLFKAYRLKPDTKSIPIKKSSSITQALKIGKNIETEQIPKYVWLVKHGEDNTSRQVLEEILVQTRMHQMMFTHALEMRGRGMGH